MKRKCALGELVFERENSAKSLLAGSAGKMEGREHSADAPASPKIPRPRKLQVGLRARTCDGLGAGRHSYSDHRGHINRSQNRANLKFDCRHRIGESGIEWTVYGSQ